MTKTEAQVSSKRLAQEASSLSPSTLITLFEIDYSNILDENTSDVATIFRFHNNVTLTTSSIWYDSTSKATEEGNLEEFIAAPIQADGFEISAKGTLPTPRLAISVNPEGIAALSQLKSIIGDLDGLIGAKVTRIRTFLSCLSDSHFPSDINGGKNPYGGYDVFAEFPRDIYFIDRKTTENKSVIEYELASVLDVEGIQLPNRIVLSTRCPWSYRGDGCFYEYNANRTSIHSNNLLPDQAPPVATDKDEPLYKVIGIPQNLIKLVGDGKWDKTYNYIIGNACYITKNGINYYYVAKLPNLDKQPPNDTYWVADRCSKLIDGCKLRFGLGCASQNLRPFSKGVLPFGGFPGCGRSR